ncbi:PDDEXK family nuclease [Klebsiella variicola]|uniref:VRR-NUC domain-containing protein n=1 Tax=Klebsiella variicola TaxID=244366 RepID=UPI00109C561C|nr:VRR-NUC domain-containing protein [Klebsiella variicola]
MNYVREHLIEEFLVREVKRRGGIAYKFVSPNRANVPDRLCIMPGGRIFFVECKAPSKNLRPGQRREIERMRDRGAEVFTLRNKDLSEIFTDG